MSVFKAISKSREDIAFVTKSLMGLPLIFCPIFMSLICYAKRTLRKQNRMALFTEALYLQIYGEVFSATLPCYKRVF